LEASEPPEARGEARDSVRLLVSDRSTGRFAHARFRDLPRLLRTDDLLVVNDSATIPAALDAARPDGTPIVVHLSTRIDPVLWIVEPRGAVDAGAMLGLPNGASIVLLAPVRPASPRLWYARLAVDGALDDYLRTYGRPIRYRHVPRAYPLDLYQTIFAQHPGSVEMPSAGRPFTARVLHELRLRGVEWVALTLHCGVASLENDESPPPERFAISPATAAAVNAARASGRRVVAVGTTVVRALESAAVDGQVVANSGWADVVVTPERGVRIAGGLLTGLHDPAASHLRLLGAFLHDGALRAAYEAAIARGYRWHEFGDLHLIV
ncbi:MAG: S-adenosylmethionine:tRNA ribosyltransferase-isomerase, partial [Vulcanimicrobiaceae bacterium]